MLENNDRILVIKYSKTPYDCIEKHINVLNQFGYCWFGKIGTSPSITAINSKLNLQKKYIVLYCQGKTHLCELIGISIEKPDCGYPDYYNNVFFRKNIFPSIYFKLASIEPLPSSLFLKCISIKSGNLLLETVSKSMASFFYGEYKDHLPSVSERNCYSIGQKKRIPKEEKAINNTKNVVVDKNSCVYRIEGMCSNKKCINYQYDCFRPSSCLKQKPIST